MTTQTALRATAATAVAGVCPRAAGGVAARAWRRPAHATAGLACVALRVGREGVLGAAGRSEACSGVGTAA